jgi:hypothetical protein
MRAGRRTSRRLRSFTLAWVLSALTLRLAAGQGTDSNGVLPAVPHEIVLQQQVLPYELESGSWDFDKTNAPFLKEPETSPQHVFRFLLRFGKDTNNAIALIWDQPKHKLYLDLNRNLDLTDDPAGAFSTTGKEFQQVLTNVTLPLKTATGLHSAILDLHLFTDAQGKWAQARLHSRSLWQAKVTPGGEEWQVAVVDNLFGQEGPVAAKFLLLRPWAARTNRVSFYDPPSGIVPFPSHLFWLGRPFQLERRFETSGETPVCKLEFTPQQPPLTELKLSGESVYYAVLRNTNGYTAMLREPPGTVQVPQGVYTANAVWLKKGPAEAFRLAGEPVLINATAPTNVALGGPLTNSVTLARSGRKLNLNYQLVGADGGAYRLAQQDPAKPPEFTVYHGGKKVLSGMFAFG